MTDARAAWNANAAYWDERMADGNSFVEHLIGPATDRLLPVTEGMRILDIACGNGVSSRRFAAAGARVTAFDFSEELIAIARKRDLADRIDYRHLDATDAQALATLGPNPSEAAGPSDAAAPYDAAVCWMALFDMEEIVPLSRALTPLLKPGAPFVFAVIHPCFNNNSTVFVFEQGEDATGLVPSHAVKISDYLTPSTKDCIAMRGLPKPHPVFHRPLHLLFKPFFDEGFVLDGLEEPGFPESVQREKPHLCWGGHLSEIPPVMAIRLRRIVS